MAVTMGEFIGLTLDSMKDSDVVSPKYKVSPMNSIDPSVEEAQAPKKKAKRITPAKTVEKEYNPPTPAK